MLNPVLYRRRLIPNECVRLKDDRILSCNEDFILTSWNALKPKIELHHGFSCYLLKEGIKLSQFYRADDSLICWYADIVEYEYQPEKNTLTSIDLLVDVIIYPDGFVKVVDLDELALALHEQLIDAEAMKRCLRTTDRFLRLVYSGEFEEIKKYFDTVHSSIKYMPANIDAAQALDRGPEKQAITDI